MDILTAAQILDRIKPGASVMLDTHSDEATMERIARNLAAFNEGTLSGAEAAGIFSVNVDELLEIIARLSAPQAATGRHATPAARDWEAEAEEFKRYAADVAADEADQRRWDRGNR